MPNMTQAPPPPRRDARYTHHRTMGGAWNMSAKRAATGPRTAADHEGPQSGLGGWLHALFG